MVRSPVSTATVAIVGAGVAGLRAGQILARAGIQVTAFEKSRGVGGRSSTRRSDSGGFDHGAQYLTLRDPGLRQEASQWQGQGWLDLWEPRLVTLRAGLMTPSQTSVSRWVGVPGMNALGKMLAAELDVRSNVLIQSIARRSDAKLELRDQQGLVPGEFDAVLVATPAPQAVPLLSAAPQLARSLEGVRFAPCWALMVTWRSPLRVPFDGAWLEESPLAWMASEASKPGRHSGLRWVLHASPEWSQSHLEDTPEEVRQALLEALGHALQAPLPETEAVSVHRWRYARVQKPLDRACLWDPEVGIGACGDWCLGERLEAALLSGQAAATGVLKSLESGVNAAD